LALVSLSPRALNTHAKSKTLLESCICLCPSGSDGQSKPARDQGTDVGAGRLAAAF
jgi:hypothetical protein